ncbi:MAG: FecR domain-containing protein, partial [Spirochaetia bacterium]|nr:FecR domain-containing protein [Spirochaetia bacterium]
MRYFSLILLLAFVSIPSCKDKSRNASQTANITGLVLFKIGTVQVAGQPVEIGAIIQAREKITVGPQSLVDIQVRDMDSSITLRLQQNSVLSLAGSKSSDGLTLSPKLTQGSLLAQVKKLDSSESLHVRLPSAVAAVRGTQFQATVDASGNSQIDVHSGKVAVRPRSNFEDLPAGLVEKTPELQSLVTALEKSETILETGKSAVVDSKASDRLIEEAGLQPVLQNPTIVSLLSKENATEQEAAAAQAILTKHFEDTAQKEKVKAAVQKPIATPQVKDVPKEELQQKLKEYEEFISIEQAKAKDNAAAGVAIKERN